MEPPGELEAFCQREYPQLVGTLSLYCGDLLLAEELAQETLARVCARWDQVEQMAAPGAWAHRVAINAANSHWRRLRAARRAHSRMEQQHQSPHHDQDVAGDVALRRAVSQLPTRQRSAVVLRYFADLSVGQVAEIMGVSDQAVRSLTHRALRKLRDVVDGAGWKIEQEESDVH